MSPTAEKVGEAAYDDIASLGIVGARAKCMIAIAQKHASGELQLEAGIHPDKAITQLTAFPGIGAWTANYIAMRALRWPDAFPKEDIVIRNNLGKVSAKRAEEMSRAWCPWRSYAVMHIWSNPLALMLPEDGNA